MSQQRPPFFDTAPSTGASSPHALGDRASHPALALAPTVPRQLHPPCAQSPFQRPREAGGAAPPQLLVPPPSFRTASGAPPPVTTALRPPHTRSPAPVRAPHSSVDASSRDAPAPTPPQIAHHDWCHAWLAAAPANRLRNLHISLPALIARRPAARDRRRAVHHRARRKRWRVVSRLPGCAALAAGRPDQRQRPDARGPRLLGHLPAMLRRGARSARRGQANLTTAPRRA